MIWISLTVGLGFLVVVLILRELRSRLIVGELTLEQKLGIASEWAIIELANTKHRLDVLEDISVLLMDLREAVENEKEAAWWHK